MSGKPVVANVPLKSSTGVLAINQQKAQSFRVMHIQQTKVESRATGGPQYYLHSVPAHVKEFLRKRGACPVLLQTPYGIARSTFTAVGRDHKLNEKGKAIAGKVGHDRIQGQESIGEAIRFWFGLNQKTDFERIDLEASIHDDGHFILTPTSVKLRRPGRPLVLEKIAFPLSFHRDHQSKLWRQQIETRRKDANDDVAWAASQIRRVASEHQSGNPKNVHEADLLRVAGALSLLGVDLSLYLTKGYDCPKSTFQFSGLPVYTCPIEIKKLSSGFNYQILRYAELPRAVVLCIKHDFRNPPDHVDFIELSTLADFLRN